MGIQPSLFSSLVSEREELLPVAGRQCMPTLSSIPHDLAIICVWGPLGPWHTHLSHEQGARKGALWEGAKELQPHVC